MKNLLRGTAAALALALATTHGAAQTQEPADQQMDASPRPAQENGLSQSDGAALGTGQCEVVQQDLDQEISEDADRRATMSSAVVRDLRGMRNTAMRLEQYGQVEACQQVAAAIREIIENPDVGPQGEARQAQEQQGQDTTGTAEQQAQGPADTAGQQAAGDAPATDQQTADDQTGSIGQGATPISEARVRADELIGTDVRSSENESIGEVDDIVISSDGSGSYVIIAHGGFLGMGQDRVAIPFDAVAVSGDQDAVVLNMTEADLEQAPSFEEGDYDWLGDEDRRRENDEFFVSR